jgi:DNA replication protein DnaC
MTTSGVQHTISKSYTQNNNEAMNTQQTLEQMKHLKLMGMLASYKNQLELPLHQQLESHELLAHLVQAELLNRGNERTAMYLKMARLRLPATIEQVECSEGRGLSKQDMAQLMEGSYILHGEPLLITGATGCGKSYLACALGHYACTQGYKVAYLNMNRFTEKIMLAKLDGSYLKVLNHYERVPLLILDDFGLSPLDHTMKLALLQILEDRYARKSIIVTSQLPVAKWHEYIQEPTLADAIMDRLTARAHRIELKGTSRRRKSSK